MRGTHESTLRWWIARPVFCLEITGLVGLANERIGVSGGVIDTQGHDQQKEG